MKTTLLLATALLGSQALHLDPNDSTSVISLDVHRNKQADPLRLRRRQVAVTLDNEEFLYFCNITLGTPPQPIRVHLDTGSSDLWVEAPTSKICRAGYCIDSGTYNSSASSTYNLVNTAFNISYADGSGASGNYGTDVISIGGKSISSLQFGIGLRATSEQAVLGIGYRTLEAGYANLNQPMYNNLPYKMVDAGLIQSPAFSLWLNDLDAGTGQILFGGVDTEKYVGGLSTVSILKLVGESSPSEFIITLTGISVNNGQQTKNVSSDPLPVVLDSGSTLSLLPVSVANELFSLAGATYDSSQGAAYVPCSLAGATASIKFSFSGIVISVPIDEMVIESPNADGTIPTDGQGHPICLFGISYTLNGAYVLGDTFLRSAYVVYDMGNNQISLAQTNFNATKSNILAIGKGSNAVPDATGVANQVTATATRSLAGVNGLATGTGVARKSAALNVVPRSGLVLAAASLAMVACLF